MWVPPWFWAFDRFMTMSAIGLLSRVASLMCWFMPWLRIGNATGFTVCDDYAVNEGAKGQPGLGPLTA